MLSFYIFVYSLIASKDLRMKKNIKFLISSLFTTLGVHFLSSLKYSFIVGSRHAFFSVASIAVPLTGVFGGVRLIAATYLLRALGTYVATGIIPIVFLVYHIPSFFASWYWCSSRRGLKAALPIVLMIAFVVHPLGPQVWPYATYWIIPFVIAVAGVSTPFFKAIGSSFIAHAVGSVLWIYTVPLEPAVWLGLIPVVAVERFIIAVGMTGIFYGVNYLITALQRRAEGTYNNRFKRIATFEYLVISSRRKSGGKI